MPDGGLKNIHQRYFSLHPFQHSLSRTSTFKYTQETVSDDLLEQVAASRILDTNLSLPLHARFLPDLTAQGAKPLFGARDEVIRLTELDFSRNTFVYCMIVSPKGLDAIPPCKNSAFHDGDVFRVTLVWSFIHLASDRTEMELLSGTSYPRWNKRRPVAAHIRSIDGTDPVESLRYATLLMNAVRIDKCSALAKAYEQDSVAQSIIMSSRLCDNPLS